MRMLADIGPVTYMSQILCLLALFLYCNMPIGTSLSPYAQRPISLPIDDFREISFGTDDLRYILGLRLEPCPDGRNISG